MKKKIRFALILALGIIWILPFFLMISTSFDANVTAIKWPITLFPESFSLEGYKEIFNNPQLPIFTWYFNSIVISTTFTILSVITFSLAGFAFAKLKFRGRNKLFYAVMLTMMIPGIMNLVPLYLIVYKMGLLGTKLSMILPGLSGAFNVFLMRQFFISIPDEIMESAYIDGASNFMIYRRIMMPMVKPALIVVALNCFMGSWNDYLWPSIVTSEPTQRTLTVGLSMVTGKYGAQFNVTLALVVVSIVPTLILYFVFQKYLLDGMNLSSGIK